jgi:predicted transcriptional regulator
MGSGGVTNNKDARQVGRERAENLSSDLRAAREHAGLTQVELAARADVSLSMVRTLEYGAIPKRSRALGRALDALAAAIEEDRTP